MNSSEKLIKNLKEIVEETTKYSSYSREEVFNICIDEKLANTLTYYNTFVDLNSRMLLRKESTRVLKALTKIQKFNDKDAIENQLESTIDI